MRGFLIDEINAAAKVLDPEAFELVPGWGRRSFCSPRSRGRWGLRQSAADGQVTFVFCLGVPGGTTILPIAGAGIVAGHQ
jgi:hypothetical protein